MPPLNIVTLFLLFWISSNNYSRKKWGKNRHIQPMNFQTEISFDFGHCSFNSWTFARFVLLTHSLVMYFMTHCSAFSSELSVLKHNFLQLTSWSFSKWPFKIISLHHLYLYSSIIDTFVLFLSVMYFSFLILLIGLFIFLAFLGLASCIRWNSLFFAHYITEFFSNN